jgi:carbon-monoxide dehydrogenase medium subunit
VQPFTLRRPTSLAEATSAFTGEAAFLAGGHTLIPAMKSRLRAVETLIDLSRIPNLDRIERTGDTLTIGATATHAAIAASPVVRAAIPGLACLAAGIGDPQVRNRGTIGGSLANNDPAADWPAAALALGASLRTSQGVHAAEDYFQGMFATVLAEGELLTAIDFPLPGAFAYAKHRHPASRYAVAGVAIARDQGRHRVAVTGATLGVSRWPAAEAALDAGTALPPALDGPDLASDLHASAEYRAHLAGVMLRQATAGLA